jgi:ketosteroid isomerase-like protein
MRRLTLLLAMTLGACGTLPIDDAGRSLAEAESAFAAHSVRAGMRAAFIAHFAPGGVFVRDGWMRAREWLEPRPDPPIELDWRPVHVDVAASGDLGLSTGPWKLVPRDRPGAPPQHGQFVSIWKRVGAERWQVEVDLGVQHPTDALWTEPLRTSRPPGPAPSGRIADAEASFAKHARESGPHAAYAAHASSTLRWYRMGEPPALGSAAAVARAAVEPRERDWAVEHVETARSGDLGYARGSYRDAGAPAASGYYLRVWRAEGGRWKIALDVINPVARRGP